MKLIQKTKQVFNSLLDKLFKHTTSICAIVGVIFICMTFCLVREVEHSKEVTVLQFENSLIEADLQKAELFLTELDTEMGEAITMIKEQGRLLNEQNQQLSVVTSALYVKQIFYNALVEYMKKIGEWPPKMPPPIDPDNLAESI